MRIIININNWHPSKKKEIVNSIRGFVKALAKRLQFEVELKEIEL